MRGIAIYLTARSSIAALGLCCITTIIVLRAGPRVFEIVFDPAKGARFTPIWEMAPVMLGVYLPFLLAPRLATWEILGRIKLRFYACGVAVAGMLLPASMPWLAHFRLPADTRWWDISCNIAVYTATAFGATAWLGRIAGPIVSLVLYLSVVAVQQVVPLFAAHLPVSGASTNLTPHPWAAFLAMLLAGVSWLATLGQSRVVRSIQRNA